MMTATRLLVAIGLASVPLAAQHPAAPMGRMMGDPMEMQEMMEPIAHVMLYAPQHLLPRKDALGLTADQVARLTALRAATTAAQDAAMTEARTHLEELQAAAEAGSPDTAAVKASKPGQEPSVRCEAIAQPPEVTPRAHSDAKPPRGEKSQGLAARPGG